MTYTPYQRGSNDCVQDRIENCPFASTGGLDKRHDMIAPEYITKHGEEYTTEYLRGYQDTAKGMFGDDWKTCKFGWSHVMTLNPDGSVEFPEQKKS